MWRYSFGSPKVLLLLWSEGSGCRFPTGTTLEKPLGDEGSPRAGRGHLAGRKGWERALEPDDAATDPEGYRLPINTSGDQDTSGDGF